MINVAILMILNGTSMNILMHDDQEWNLNEYIYIYIYIHTHFDHIEVRFTQALTILAEF